MNSCIPSLLHANKYIVDFKEKSRILIVYFANQYSPIPNGGFIPTGLSLKADSILSSCHFTEDDIVRIINNLDRNKPYGHDKISIYALKICGDSIRRPLQLIFEICLHPTKFPLK